MRLLLTAIIILPLPLVILAYYVFRLGLRRALLQAKIQELGLEREYLRVFHYNEWEKVKRSQGAVVATEFQRVFAKQFKGDNSFRNYLLPFLLLLATTILFGLVVWNSLATPRSVGEFTKAAPLPFAIAGALLYTFPSVVTRYASLSLNPQTILEQLGKLWLSVVVGVILSSVIVDQLAAAVAFIGGLIPGPAIELLQKRVYGNDQTGRGAAATQLLGVLCGDETLLSQLTYVGVRSVLELAYENPLKIFVETDLNLLVCIDLVDQANLLLYVPDPKTRTELNRYGVRTAIDLMTQVYVADDPKDPDSAFHFIGAEEELPRSLQESLTKIAGALNLELPAFRNMLQMMIDNPGLRYVLSLWSTVNEDIEIREAEQPAVGKPEGTPKTKVTVLLRKIGVPKDTQVPDNAKDVEPVGAGPTEPIEKQP